MRVKYILIIIFLLIMINFYLINSKASKNDETRSEEIWDTDKIILKDLTIDKVTIEPGITIYFGKG